MSDLTEAEMAEYERLKDYDTFKAHMDRFLAEQGAPAGQERATFRAMIWSGQIVVKAHSGLTGIIALGLVAAGGLFVGTVAWQELFGSGSAP